jgi:hypothetical protein
VSEERKQQLKGALERLPLELRENIILYELEGLSYKELAVADLAEAGYKLVGGRLDILEDRPVATVVYRHQDQFINEFLALGDASDRFRCSVPSRVQPVWVEQVWI